MIRFWDGFLSALGAIPTLILIGVLWWGAVLAQGRARRSSAAMIGADRADIVTKRNVSHGNSERAVAGLNRGGSVA